MRIPRRLVTWFLGTYPGRLIQAYAGSQAGNYAGGLAFTAFISMFPLMLGLLAIIGLVVSSAHAQAQVENALLGFFPRNESAALRSALRGIHQYSGVLGIVGLIGLLWSGSSLFTSLEWTLGQMIGARQRGFVRQRLMALVMTVAFVVAVVAAVGVNSIVALSRGVPALEALVGGVVWVAFMALLYRAVPNRTYRLAQLWRGALLAGALMELLTLAWPLYTGLVHGFSTYGKVFALFFVLATWLYFWAQFVLIGAVANRMRAGRPGARGLVAEPEPDALETAATRAADVQAQPRRQAA
jgi:YihY family inner membrane protein